MIPDDPEKSISGRQLYCEAIAQYLSGFWESLRDYVLYPCEVFALLARGEPILDAMAESAQACLDEWLLDWQIVDEWLMDISRHTLNLWAGIAHDHGRTALDPRWTPENRPSVDT